MFRNQFPTEDAMDGADPNFLPQKKLCGRRREDDRISELPEEIITFILSLLSVKEAAATSILSHRWSNLWKHTPHLIFTSKISVQESSWDAESCEYIKLVNSVLRSHKTLFLKQFKISFFVNKSAQPQVHKWLEFLLSRRVESLELDFLGYNQYEPWRKVVLGDLIRESRIQSADDVVLFKSLKSLCLASFKVSGEDIELILRKCPLLERLAIRFSTLTSDVDVSGGADLNLKRFDICGCSRSKSIKVSAPKLTSIRFGDSSGKVVFENVPSLIGAEFRVERSKFVSKQLASNISCFVSQLRTLKLTLHCPKVFLWSGFRKMPKLKTLIVKYYGLPDHGVFLGLSALIWSFPRLQQFIFQFVGVVNDVNAQMKVVTNVKGSPPHRHLKVFSEDLVGATRIKSRN